MTCLSTLQPLEPEGYTPAALAGLSDGREFPSRLHFTRADLPSIRVGEAARLSISGVQDKVSLRLEGGRLIPTERGGQYILKPIPGPRLPAFHDDIPANEHVTMQIAEQVFAIRTARNALIRMADGELAYLTRRFDRGPDGRAPQEDFAQLTGRYKYDGSYEALGAALRRFSAAPDDDALELFRRIIFSYAISNGDAHLKNFSLLGTPDGRHRLSPAYDLMSSTLHLPNEARLALDLFEADEPDGLRLEGFETGRDLAGLARRFEISPRQARQVIEAPAALRASVHDLVGRSFLSPPARDRYLANLDDRLRALAQ